MSRREPSRPLASPPGSVSITHTDDELPRCINNDILKQSLMDSFFFFLFSLSSSFLPFRILRGTCCCCCCCCNSTQRAQPNRWLTGSLYHHHQQQQQQQPPPRDLSTWPALRIRRVCASSTHRTTRAGAAIRRSSSTGRRVPIKTRTRSRRAAGCSSPRPRWSLSPF